MGLCFGEFKVILEEEKFPTVSSLRGKREPIKQCRIHPSRSSALIEITS